MDEYFETFISSLCSLLLSLYGYVFGTICRLWVVGCCCSRLVSSVLMLCEQLQISVILLGSLHVVSCMGLHGVVRLGLIMLCCGAVTTLMLCLYLYHAVSVQRGEGGLTVSAAVILLYVNILSFVNRAFIKLHTRGQDDSV